MATDMKAWEQLQESASAHGVTHWTDTNKKRVVMKARGACEIVVLGTGPSNNSGIQMQLGDSGVDKPVPGKA